MQQINLSVEGWRTICGVSFILPFLHRKGVGKPNCLNSDNYIRRCTYFVKRGESPCADLCRQAETCPTRGSLAGWRKRLAFSKRLVFTKWPKELLFVSNHALVE